MTQTHFIHLLLLLQPRCVKFHNLRGTMKITIRFVCCRRRKRRHALDPGKLLRSPVILRHAGALLNRGKGKREKMGWGGRNPSVGVERAPSLPFTTAAKAPPSIHSLWSGLIHNRTPGAAFCLFLFVSIFFVVLLQLTRARLEEVPSCTRPHRHPRESLPRPPGVTSYPVALLE